MEQGSETNDDLPNVDMTVRPSVTGFFDAATNTIIMVQEPDGKSCAVIDSVMDIDYAAGRITHDSADQIIAHIRDKGLTLDWIIETHVHADHLSAAPYLQDALGGRIGIGAKIMDVQEVFGKIFNEGTEFQRDGSQFDALFEDGDTYVVGAMTAQVMATPGHTPACMVTSWAMRPLSVTRCSCPMEARRAPTFPAEMLVNFMTLSRGC